MRDSEGYQRLIEHGVKPSVQRLAIMQYLMTHFNHPTVEQVYQGLCDKIPTLSRTTVYNTLRLFSERGAATMITIECAMTVIRVLMYISSAKNVARSLICLTNRLLHWGIHTRLMVISLKKNNYIIKECVPNVPNGSSRINLCCSRL